MGNAAECSDLNDGRSPANAWASLRHAAEFLNSEGVAGAVVLVGPGVYAEGDVSLQRSGVAARPIQLRADSNGGCTGDAPGQVVVDAGYAYDTGFLVRGASHVVVDGFAITKARVAGIQVRTGLGGETPRGVVLANNVLFANGGYVGRGVDLQGAAEPLVFNNLVFNNTTTGIGVLGTPRARLVNNTLFGNGGNGIVIDSDAASQTSPGAWVINNIVANVGAASTAVAVGTSSRCDYIGAFNLLAIPSDSYYSPSTPRDPSDIRVADAGFVAPQDGNFALLPSSPAIDAGSVASGTLGLAATSATGNGTPDAGKVDIGYHAGNAGFPALTEVPLTTARILVRAGGSDAGDGSSPATALATIGAAIARARAATEIVVGPGTYSENIAIGSLKPAGPIALIGDQSGEQTGDTPGLVLVDATSSGDAVGVVGHCSTTIDGLAVRGAGSSGDTAHGISVKQSHNSVVRNAVAFSNSGVGINVVDSDDVGIVNNLVYANGTVPARGGGIQVGGKAGSKGTLVQSNTVFGNGVVGILIGTDPDGPSTGASVFYNALQANGENGIQVGNYRGSSVHLTGYSGGYNINFEGKYGSGTPRPATDLIGFDPHFVDPAAGDFHLAQRAAGQAEESPAVDYGDISSAVAGLAGRTTRTDFVTDEGAVDVGYHYPVLPQPTSCYGEAVGDCNGDGRVTIDELIRAVNLALGALPVESCPAADCDGDGSVRINELICAVSSALGY